MKAKLIKEHSGTNFIGDLVTRRMYLLDPPYEGNRYVVTSSVTIEGDPETLVFPCKYNGEIISSDELVIVYSLDPSEAIKKLGYNI